MILIRNGMVKTMAGPDIIGGDVLVDGGKIAAVGKNLSTPEGTEIIDATGLLVTPGLVEAHCHTGLREAGIRDEGEDVNEQPESPVTPHLRIIDAFNPGDTAIQAALASGVTTAMVTTGSLNVVGGQAAVLKLGGRWVDDMVLKFPAAVKMALGENTKRNYGAYKKSPCTRLGVAGIARDALAAAREYGEAKGRGEHPKLDSKLEALQPVLRGEIPVKIHAHRLDDIFTGIRIAKEFGLKATLEHCTEGYLAAEEIAECGFPVILGPYLTAPSKYELKNATPGAANILYDAGVKFAIMTDAPVVNQEFLGWSAGIAVKYGLPEEAAWRAITIHAAEIIGVADRVGSLEVGKDADIAIFDGNPVTSVVFHTRLTMVDGKAVYRGELEE